MKIRKNTNEKLNFDALKVIISDYLKRNHKKAFNRRQLLKACHSANTLEDMDQVLSRLIQTKRVVEVKKDLFQAISSSSKSEWNKASGPPIEGRLEVIRSGAAYVVSDQTKQDTYIPSKFLNTAIHGDIVSIVINPSRKGRPEGRVMNIIRRETHFFVGTIHLRKLSHLVYPDNPLHKLEIHVKDEDSLQAKDGDKVILQIISWRDGHHRFPLGKITQVLGKGSSINNEMMGILINHGFPLSFSPEALAVAETVGIMPENKSWPDRKDFRSVTTFTIDPLTAKDFDDALSFQILADGNLEIGVHIADASHYLQEGTALDTEAFAKSTSVYLVDRALPMLPDILSGDVCSLKPNVDRLTFSVVFIFDPIKYSIKSSWIGKTVIHSDRRFTYEEAQEILDNKQGQYFDELNKLNIIAHHLRKIRFEHGSIGFESPEFHFELDPVNGKPIAVKEKIRKDAHLLIEDYMLLANKAVAEYIHLKEKNQALIPFVYRVHDLPDLEKLRDLSLFAKELGYELKIQSPKEISKSLNALYEAVAANDTLKLLQPLAIRTMAKATYSTNNIGHYGLGFSHYSHFTSPIRRYSDILSHRLLFQNLNSTYRVDKDKLEESCKHISNQERKATEAERDSTKYFQLLFIADHVGNEFNGVISGMIERGIFIELDENHVEGFVPMDRLPGSFEMAANRLKITSRKMTLSIGDKIRIRIKEADMVNRRVEMEFVDKL